MSKMLRAMTAAALLLAFGCSVAEDVDLFVGVNPTSSGDLPEVLILLDNAANFSANAANCKYSDGTSPSLDGTAGGIQQCAIYNVIDGLEVNPDGSAKVKIGFMSYNANNMRDISGANCGGQNGGCLNVPLMPMTSVNKTTLKDWVKSWKTTGGAGSDYIKGAGEATAALQQEAWAYYSGKTGLSGRNYAGLAPTVGCQKQYLIFVANAFNNSGTPGDTGNVSPKAALEGTASPSGVNANPAASTVEKAVMSGSYLTKSCGTATFSSSNHENPGLYADEWSRYIYNSKSIITYTIGLIGSSCKPDYPALLDSMALVGHGQYFETDNYTSLYIAFNTILSEIQAKSSVFASVSLPVSVNTQGTYLNQVFVGMFRPDKDALPRWDGNLKQYKLGFSDSVLKLLDADSSPAINTTTGFVSECKRSFWTPTSVDSYWSFSPRGECSAAALAPTATAADLKSSNYPDGNFVEKGAQAYKLRALSGASARTVYSCSGTWATCAGGSGSSTPPVFNSSVATTALLGAASDTERDALIAWAKGQDVDEENNNANTAEIRPSVHGDIVHSRPVAVNYGADDERQVVVFYGGNDGMLRAINGNRDDGTNPTPDIGTVTPGSELWAFMPPEFFGNIKRLRTNSPEISYKGTSISGAIPKAYGFDGPMVAYDTGTTKYLYASMRRGGRALYAFNVTSAAEPKLMWKVGCPKNFPTSGTIDDSGCGAGWSGIGQTWSAPRVMKAAGYNAGSAGTEKPLLVFGGGYDTCEDADDGTNNNTCSSTKGGYIYIVDAVTGALLKALPTSTSSPGGSRAVIGDLTVVNDSSTGLAKYVYAADLGGNVWRVNVGSASNLSDWTITQVASLGCDTVASCNANRKFMFAPDVVYENGTYILLLGSGDREKPLMTYTAAKNVSNYFFMIQDRPNDSSWLSNESTNCGAGNNVICLSSLLPISGSATPTTEQLSAKKGWYLSLASTEQVVTSAITVYGVVTFSTHAPAVYAAGQCTPNLGTANVYNIRYANAAGLNGGVRFEAIHGGGLPPSPVAGKVTLDDGSTVPFVIGGSPNSALEGKQPTVPPTPTSNVPRVRTYWYMQR